MEEIIVVKVGGSLGIDYDAVCDDIATLRTQGHRIVLIHGGSQQTNEVAEALGHPARFITSPSGFTSRYTDSRTMEIFEMVYCGQMNKGIVTRLQARGVNAFGFSGIDGGLWRGARKKAIRAVENGRRRIIRDSYTGRVECVNLELLMMFLERDVVPVITPPALSYENEAINVDGDRAAAATAAALHAQQLLILSNIPGVLANFPDEDSLIQELAPADLSNAIEQFAQGRMRIKLLGAQEAIQGGVAQVIIGDARGPNPILQALEGNGTSINAAIPTPIQGMN